LSGLRQLPRPSRARRDQRPSRLRHRRAADQPSSSLPLFLLPVARWLLSARRNLFAAGRVTRSAAAAHQVQHGPGVGFVDDQDVDDSRSQDAENRERLFGLAQTARQRSRYGAARLRTGPPGGPDGAPRSTDHPDVHVVPEHVANGPWPTSRAISSVERQPLRTIVQSSLVPPMPTRATLAARQAAGCARWLPAGAAHHASPRSRRRPARTDSRPGRRTVAPARGRSRWVGRGIDPREPPIGADERAVEPAARPEEPRHLAGVTTMAHGHDGSLAEATFEVSGRAPGDSLALRLRVRLRRADDHVGQMEFGRQTVPRAPGGATAGPGS